MRCLSSVSLLTKIDATVSYSSLDCPTMLVKTAAMLVCYAKHSAASYTCCKDSGTAQLQHMQCDSESPEYERQHSYRPQSSVSSIAMHS